MTPAWEMNFWLLPANFTHCPRTDVLRFGLRCRAPSRAITSHVESTFYYHLRCSRCHQLLPMAVLTITAGYEVRLLWGGLSQLHFLIFRLTSRG